ncbi:MAG: MbnP family protein [Bacteroidia bacterium]
MSSSRTFLILFFFALIASSFVQEPVLPFTIRFEPVYENEALVLNKKAYRNSAGDTLFIDLFKFYISNVAFKSAGKWHAVKNSYYLINAEEPSSLVRKLNLPVKEADSIRFLIGVDSLTCVSGIMTGDLDPLKAMYWSWNTGYVNAKIEGRSASCKTVHNVFEFHIGGYMQPYNTLRTVAFKISNHDLRLKAKADQWFDGREKINLGKTNSIVTTGKDAVMMAGNYKDMFELVP